MRNLGFIMLLLAVVACGDAGGTTTDTGPGSTTGGSTGTTVAEPTSGGTTSSTTATSDATSSSAGTGETSGTTAVDSTTGTTGDTTLATTGTTTHDTTAGDTTEGSTTADTTTESGGESTGGTSPLVIAIVDAELWADCMPEVEPDPVKGSWFVEFDNTANPNDTQAIVTGAWLSPTGGDPKAEPISVAPEASGPIPAGEYVSLPVKKLVGESHSACSHCGEFYDLVLEYDEGGIVHHVEEAVTISCAF